MKKLEKLLSLCLALALCLSIAPAAFAANADDARIDETRLGSFELYKYDMTNAEKDGVWDSSYVSTGVKDDNVNNTLGNAIRAGDDDSTSNLGNGQTSNGYAIQGVEFTYLKVADIRTYTASENGVAHIEVLYGFNSVAAEPLLTAIALTGDDRYVPADDVDNADIHYYQSDVLVNALRTALVSNATAVKNALETYVKANGGTAMALTDEDGHSAAKDLPLGLYLVVETKVPEMVTNTTNPFFLSLPMTSVNGSNAADGGMRWMYDICLYPKNETGIPTLEKTVRESQGDTGKNGASNDIGDGFEHNATGSAGDIMEYQIISALPSITSAASQLSVYDFVDTLSAGLSYTKGDVVLEFFTDPACTDKIAVWNESDGKFTVTYNPDPADPAGDVSMTIAMTEAGLTEINTSDAVYAEADQVRRGYSDCTLRITYTAKIDSDNTAQLGDKGNPNDVVLTWKRTSSEYWDTLVDDAHVYTYGIELTKVFAGKDGNPEADGDFSKVQFVVYNKTDRYWVEAARNETEGVYYVTDHLPGEELDNEAANATVFVPAADGKIVIKGLEDDEYILTEIQTDNGYTLLKDSISVVISQAETESFCDIYATDIKGLLQNDPRYAEILAAGNVDTVLGLSNMPQEHLEHHLLTASAAVDGNDVTMLTDRGSDNAEAPLTVVNTHGFDLPQTGEMGARWLPILGGISLGLAGAAMCIVLLLPKKKQENR